MMTKTLASLMATLVLTGCATAGKAYLSLPPAQAITAIAADLDGAASSREVGMSTSIFIKESAFAGMVNAAQGYCTERGGRVSRWAEKPGAFNCVQPGGKIEFAMTHEPSVFGAKAIQVTERTPENEAIFNLLLLGMGYRSDEQIMAEQRQRLSEAQEEQRKAKDKLMAQRIENRDLVAYTGAGVCQRQPHMMGSEAILIGTVEQVSGDKLKVFMARAVIAGAPGISPGGFKQHYTWVNYWDVEACD